MGEGRLRGVINVGGEVKGGPSVLVAFWSGG